MPSSKVNQPAVLRAENVSRVYGSGKNAFHALFGANLHVFPKQLIAIKGRSGSGKTTLLNLLAALDDPSDGDIYHSEQRLSDLSVEQKDNLRQKHIGLVFQSFALVPHMTAYENVEFGLRIARVGRSLRKQWAQEALAFVGLQKRMNHQPQELSGGEQQRTAIARAIAFKPRLILADEPTAELDTKTGMQVMQLFRRLVEEQGISIVMTTHDPAVMDIVDNVYGLEDGKIVAET